MKRPDYTINIFESETNAAEYQTVPIVLSDPRGKDPLVRPRDFGVACESFYARTDGQNWPYHSKIKGSLPDVWCRGLVAEKLKRVNGNLRPYDAELFVWDAYRPIDTQWGLWAVFWAKAVKEIPNGTDEERRNHVLSYVSDATRFTRSDPTTWPVHTSGGVIDLTLRSLDT